MKKYYLCIPTPISVTSKAIKVLEVMATQKTGPNWRYEMNDESMQLYNPIKNQKRY